MTDSSSTPVSHVGGRYRKLALGCLASALSLAGVVGAVFTGAGGSAAVSAAQPAVGRPAVTTAQFTDAIATEFSRFVLNALLLPLLDDDEPPRWTDVALRHFCGPATNVEVDGRSLSHGTSIPATPFTVRWDMDRCTPLEAFELSGTVELLVFREGAGLAAIVNPDGLIIASVSGTGRLPASFSSWASLLPSPHRP